MRTLISVAVLAVVIALSYHEVKSQGATSFSGFDLVDKTGNIRKPDGYRDHYQILGTFTVLNAIPMAPGPSKKGTDIHYTYASPGTAEYYRKTGKFPDEAVLVKEVFGTDHGTLTTGDAHWASGTKQWFVMIKDEKGRYPGNPLWGDGWGGHGSILTSHQALRRQITKSIFYPAMSRRELPIWSMSKDIPR